MGEFRSSFLSCVFVIFERWSLALESFPLIESIPALPAMPRKPACHSAEKIFDTMSYRPTAVCRSTRRAAHCSCPRVWLNPVADEMLGCHNRLVGRWNNSSYTDWSACKTREYPRGENFGHVSRCRCIAQLVISAHTDEGWNPSVLLSRS